MLFMSKRSTIDVLVSFYTCVLHARHVNHGSIRYVDVATYVPYISSCSTMPS